MGYWTEVLKLWTNGSRNRRPRIVLREEIVAFGLVDAVSLAESPTTTLLLESQLMYEAVHVLPYSLGTTSGCPFLTTATQLCDVPMTALVKRKEKGGRSRYACTYQSQCRWWPSKSPKKGEDRGSLRWTVEMGH